MLVSPRSPELGGGVTTWFDESGAGGSVDVEALLDGKVGELAAAIVAAGALLSMGLTSDGGALGMTVTLDSRWRREYFRDAESAESWLLVALDAVISGVAGRPASSGPRSRPRSR
jgi:hypothetical protein